MEPLSVVLVSGYLGSGGGAERQITELARNLDPARFRTSVVSLVSRQTRSRHGGAHFRRLEEAGVEIVTLERSLRIGPGQIVALARWLRARRPNVVHSFLFSENWRTRIAALAAPGARVISSERSVNTWKRWRHHALERLLIRVTDRVVANAEAIRRFLVEEGGLPASKIVVIPNGVDTTRFAPRGDRNRARAERGWGPETLVIGHTGTMVPHKGQSEVLRAVALAAKRLPSIRVVLLGDGPDRGALEALARALGLEGRIEMPGFVGDVESLLPCLDVYVHFSREREGCSNAILEAMACGLPVIATDVGGNRELVEEGRTGCLVGEEDIEAVASALVRLGLDATLRKEFGRAAARVVGERFSVPKMVGATAALYEAVCAEGTPGGGR